MKKLNFDNLQQLSQYLQQCVGNSHFCQTIYNSPTPVLGTPIPILRKIAKCIDVQLALSLPYNTYVEYDIIKGLSIVNQKLPLSQKSEQLVDFAVYIDNWATCDTCICNVKCNEKQEYFDFFKSLLSRDEPFVVRYALVNLRRNFIDQQYVNDMISAVCQVEQGHYYIDMAIAWLIADVAVDFAEIAKNLLMNDCLTFTVKKMALQKMRDSRRISESLKQWTRTVLK